MMKVQTYAWELEHLDVSSTKKTRIFYAIPSDNYGFDLHDPILKDFISLYDYDMK